MSTKTLHNITEDKITYRDQRYSGFIRPLSYLIDLSLIVIFASHFFASSFDVLTYGIFIGICWVLVSMQFDFYKTQRNTDIITLLGRLVKQAVVFAFMVFAFFGFYYEINNNTMIVSKYLLWTMGTISVIKISLFYILKHYRSVLGGNFRNVVLLGVNKDTKQLSSFFNKHKDYGYRTQNIIDTSSSEFSMQEFQEYVLDNQIDEIFCSVRELKNEDLIDLTEFVDNNLRTLKFIPDTDMPLSRQLHYEYYGRTPIISLRQIPLDDFGNQFIKRAFDILFSLFVIVFLMSWLTPLIALIIKLESKGPVFFTQKRNGLDYKEFTCFKFRSMVPNNKAHLEQVTRGDQRITKIGRFLRKTSIDELPQFFNVLLGSMSVVGPRPHMVSHTHMYAERIDKFMVRHFVKPGITGLAQVSGYRGEVETEDDIKGRVRNDIYYIENWNINLDIKIIIKTITNVFKGEEKAY
ncbi:undecaprenyl-phosphate glucose phosphotransferase [Nonlabens tegetincola]|uniref:undecaprenyl-phosphate glucose phosphotransferase n=1 Tax=Nonlabens tegetincola TaxID=323273 RepID=UPI000A26D479|nr:undecaprenyl-phosphate glucose phosphotransferase [Nonlabens tegetincola]